MPTLDSEVTEPEVGGFIPCLRQLRGSYGTEVKHVFKLLIYKEEESPNDRPFYAMAVDL